MQKSCCLVCFLWNLIDHCEILEAGQNRLLACRAGLFVCSYFKSLPSVFSHKDKNNEISRPQYQWIPYQQIRSWPLSILPQEVRGAGLPSQLEGSLRSADTKNIHPQPLWAHTYLCNIKYTISSFTIKPEIALLMTCKALGSPRKHWRVFITFKMD